ncbi:MULTISPECIES: hypothetical protein [unclassified Treponema]|uniref:hypothetical protein n=1 Tax=unclassified Treponema TaxID=2638727 RepID=UPI0005301006|nr:MULTISPECIES: hypothetical protein [unclassified Treponema]AIW88954.1 hypothetical protein JO41_03345 [Treponema sp. OMZ 838]UTC44504.1 hypothetical protein E4N66_10740 [Treponema sp. OMZ 857]UTC51097.1 hypothetical protein E4N65_01760 [Treponema sp. OMZ 855]
MDKKNSVFKILKKDLTLFFICLFLGLISIFVSIAHRLQIDSISYTDQKWIGIVFSVFLIYILSILIFLLVGIIFRAKDKEYKIFLVDIVLLAFLCLIFILIIYIDYPTLVYMT